MIEKEFFGKLRSSQEPPQIVCRSYSVFLQGCWDGRGEICLFRVPEIVMKNITMEELGKAQAAFQDAREKYVGWFNEWDGHPLPPCPAGEETLQGPQKGPIPPKGL